MSSPNPPQYGYAYEFYTGLISQANTKIFQVNPTLAAGDVKIRKDGGAESNVTTLPTVLGSGKVVKVVLSATEMEADNITLTFADAAGSEWCDLIANIPTWRTLLRQGTAQGGAGAYIDLDTGSSSSDDFYNNALIHIYKGTGIGQSRIISDYTGSSRRATVNENWVTNPDSTSEFKIYPSSSISSTAPTAAEISDAVWDEATSGHTTAGTTGKALTDAGSAGDPWTTALPGAYGAGTAGKIVGDNINAPVSSRMASYTQPTGFLAAAFPGSVASPTNITAATGITVATNNDKTGYGLSASAIQAIWDALTSALTTVGSIGKKLADWTIGTAQTGDAFARLGAPAGASVSADIAAVKAVEDAVKVKTDFLPSATAGASGGLFIAGANAATTVNLTGNLSGSVGSVTAGVTVTTNNDKTGYRLSATGVADLLATALTESYAADGAAPTLSQALFQIQQFLTERSISSTTMTVKKLDGTTSAMTLTLDSASSPTSITRAT
jgi:hypothetical protein